ncbi:hypothetical protein [Paraglaciecola chathamensis]|uniref:Uncharacterized protein n=1 Tax=Paraglaciecola agarilytica NO2 TaxID=1125747 RepID=A0ABQ0I1T6_9ALTE|nr:hypothetical protein [Paraglaciecola agarilytica]GAC03276.1 hypothetical protein GAGA_0411 [Paraglaciecola agarilytica NO2]
MILFGEGDNQPSVIDTGFYYLEQLLASIDLSLTDINRQIDASGETDREYLCDHGEYLIGVGFCAMQRYLFDFLQDEDIDPGLARELGPHSTKGVPIAKLIHAAGNYWKHEPEWHVWLTELKKRSQDTVDAVLHGKDSSHYPLAALLYELSGNEPLLLSNCLPHLTEWRDHVVDKLTKSA